jgi:hypothetical protein
LEFLQERLSHGITVGSVRDYSVAVGLFKKRRGALTVGGSNPLISEWLKGAFIQNPPVRRLIPPW